MQRGTVGGSGTSQPSLGGGKPARLHGLAREHHCPSWVHVCICSAEGSGELDGLHANCPQREVERPCLGRQVHI